MASFLQGSPQLDQTPCSSLVTAMDLFTLANHSMRRTLPLRGITGDFES